MKRDYLLPYADLLPLDKIEESCRQQEKKLRAPEEISQRIKANECDFNKDFVQIGDPSQLNEKQKIELEEQALSLIPWRKGPFELFGLELDAEWRSDYKWNRLAPQLSSLEGRRVLDVGCNNGYYMFRMLASRPELVLGIDPSIHCQAQFNFIQSYAQAPNIHFELLGIEHLSLFPNFFDTIFCMGIIYHHRHPIQQLLDLRSALKVGGEVIIETIGIPGDESSALFPEDRYANMRNVWFIPTLSCFINWAKKAHFKNIEVISDSLLTPEEQRNTRWCPPPHQSLEDFLDPQNPQKTIEGHPAPRRFCIKAQKTAP